MHASRALRALLLPMGLTAGLAWADEAIIGHVKTTAGQAYLMVAGKTVAAEPGLAVLKGQVLTTDRTGSLGVTLLDNTVLSMGPDSELVVAEYAYAPGRSELSLLVRMTKGTLHYISGVIAKLRPEGVSIKTPTGLIGVRGTELVLRVNPLDFQ